MKTEMNQTHTPTPWSEMEGSRDSKFNYIVGPKAQMICEIDISHPQLKADATFIVRAVNSHEENLQMLAHIESWLRDSFFDKTEDKCRSKADEIAQIIAKAEGK